MATVYLGTKRKRSPDLQDMLSLVPATNLVTGMDEQDGTDSGLGEQDADSDTPIEGPSDEESVPDVQCEYNASDESLPSCPAYDPEFKQNLEEVKTSLRQLQNIASRFVDKSDRAKTLRADVGRLLDAREADQQRIAIVGSSGVGKSSLVNCLMDIPSLGLARSHGGSCTFVCTEYSAPLLTQTSRFMAKVNFERRETIRKFLMTSLTAYYDWKLHCPEDYDHDEEVDMPRRAESAVQNFRLLFCKHPEFSSKDAADDYLSSESASDKAQIAQNMLAWCDELLDQRDLSADRTFELFRAETVEELHNSLDPLITNYDQNFRQPSYWPLICNVQVGVKDCEILQYATLIDLPGITDTNTLRRGASEKFLKSCNWIWIVDKIDRILTDSEVNDLLRRYGRLRPIIVCTNIDDHVDGNISQLPGTYEHHVTQYKHFMVEERRLRKRVSDLEKKVAAKLQSCLDGSMNARDPTILGKLHSQYNSAKQMLQDAQAELGRTIDDQFAYLVNWRSSHVRSCLSSENGHHLAVGSVLESRFVSNTHYESWKGVRRISGPRLPVQLTGIPMLRDLIRRRAAISAFEAAEYLIDHDFMIQIRSTRLLVTQHPITRNDQLLQAVNALGDEIMQARKAYNLSVTEAVDQYICQPIRESLPKIINNAVGVWDKKKPWHYSTLRAFIRRDGFHATAMMSRESWNDQFLQEPNDIIEDSDGWNLLCTAQKERIKIMGGKTISILRKVPKLIHQHAAGLLLPHEEIDALLEAHQSKVRRACRQLQRDTDNETANIRLDLSHDRPSSFFMAAMHPIYETLQLEHGYGAKQRVIATMQTHLTLPGSDSPFIRMIDSFVKSWEADFNNRLECFEQSAKDTLADVHRQLQDIFNGNIEGRSGKQFLKALEAWLDSPDGESKADDIRTAPQRIVRRYERSGAL